MNNNKPFVSISDVNDTLFHDNSFFYLQKNSCKRYTLLRLDYNIQAPPSKDPTVKVAGNTHVLDIKGNVLYDINYRSYVDTPYTQRNVYQHTIQSYLDLTWKNSYPFRIYLTNHFGNSPFFKNYMDINFQYNPGGFAAEIKTRLMVEIKKRIPYDSLEKMEQLLNQKKAEYRSVANWLKDPALLQRLIELKEKRLSKNNIDRLEKQIDTIPEFYLVKGILHTPEIKNNAQRSISNKASKNNEQTSVDTSWESLDSLYQCKQAHIDSLSSNIVYLDSMFQVSKSAKQRGTDQIVKEIMNISSSRALEDRLQQWRIPDSLLPRGYKALLALRSFKLGRGTADYSDLSVKNISINGVQAEYNSKFYYAFAAGTVDYHFEDYLISHAGQPKQYLGLVRAGKGEKEGNHLFLTYYTGQRQLYNAVPSQTSNAVPHYNLMGISIEARLKLNNYTFFMAEVAKSSLPYYSSDSAKARSLLNNIARVGDRSNEAYTASVSSFVPATQTTVLATYRHIGGNFQSFSLFTSGSVQTSWSVKLNQPFFKHRLDVTLGVRANDFVNSFITTYYQSNSVLKSIQVSLRIRKLPIFSLGYYPSSQIIKLGDARFSQNLFYTLMGSASHFYKFARLQYSTMLVFTQFYNKSSDSGFVYFNTKNLLIGQSAFIGRLTMQLNLSGTANPDYHLYTLEAQTTFRVSRWLSSGGGAKYNRQTRFNSNQWGYSGNVQIKIPYFGDIQLLIDKGFIPGESKRLVENNTGRITYFKTF